MMKYFRNPEIQKLILLYILLTVLCTAVAYRLGCALPVFAVSLIFAAVSMGVTLHRYRRIEQLAASVDELLHSNRPVSFAHYREGELSVLENEISKMTGRLLEQADQLQRDKKYLSDAMADISHQLRSPLTSSQLILSLIKDTDRQEFQGDSEAELFVREHPRSSGMAENADAESALHHRQFMEEPESGKQGETGSNDILRRRQLLMELERLLSHMGWLIESMLKMSKMDAGTAYMKSEPVYIKELLQKSLEPLMVPMELRGISYVQEGVTEEAFFIGDSAWFGEAILNVVKNCMEHTPDGGCITISCEDTPLYLKLVIEDDGEGFDAEDLPHIFERFYKGKNAGSQSVGIGLALSRMIIAQMNGSIKAENRPQGGARFTMKV
ncbi:MAG: HAMP domain-containing histidine kinase [Clostridiales bacterium]|nr:HAMP domain-containing histidine kinase [Clostridiales bacterium]